MSQCQLLPMVMVTEIVQDPANPNCNPTMHAGTSVGVVHHVEEEKKVTPTTVAMPIAIRSSSESRSAVQDLGDRVEPEPVSDLRGFRKRWSSKRSSGSVASRESFLDHTPLQSPDPIEQGTPPFVQSPDNIEDPDSPSGPVMNREASERQTNHDFLSNVKWAAFKMPWEMPAASSVFNADVVAPVDFRQDPSWSAMAVLAPPPKEGSQEVPSAALPEAPTFIKCIRSIRETTFKDMRDAEMQAGLEKWNIVIRADSKESRVGRQIEESPESCLEILRACMGVKSPSTVMGRANYAFVFEMAHGEPSSRTIPASSRKPRVGVCIFSKSSSKAPASRASAFIQSCRFAHFVLGMRGADEIFNSGRIVGLSDIQLSQKDVTKQARPLTVFEMQQLHNIASKPGSSSCGPGITKDPKQQPRRACFFQSLHLRQE